MCSQYDDPSQHHREPCTGPTGRGKLTFPTRAIARQAARSLGRTFDGKSKKVYACPAAIGVGHYHLATRK